MNIGDLRTLLLKHEGLRLFPYEDTVGKLTIGIGHNLTDIGISSDIAEQMFLEDVAKVERRLVTFEWFNLLDDLRQMVIFDMSFNMGIDGVLGFHQMIAALRVKDYQEAAHQMLESDWAEQVGVRANELANMMLTGVGTPHV